MPKYMVRKVYYYAETAFVEADSKEEAIQAFPDDSDKTEQFYLLQSIDATEQIEPPDFDERMHDERIAELNAPAYEPDPRDYDRPGEHPDGY